MKKTLLFQKKIQINFQNFIAHTYTHNFVQELAFITRMLGSQGNGNELLFPEFYS